MLMSVIEIILSQPVRAFRYIHLVTILEKGQIVSLYTDILFIVYVIILFFTLRENG